MTRWQRIAAIIAVVIAVVIISVIAIRTTTPPAQPDAAVPSPAISMSEPTPSPTPTMDPAIPWADAVCRSAIPVRDEVLGVGADLAVPIGPDALDTVKQRLGERMDRVTADLTPLAVAVGQVPIDLPEAQALANTLQPQVAVLQAAVSTLRDAVTALQSSDSIPAFLIELPTAVSAGQDAAAAAKRLWSSLRDASRAAGDRLGPAFDAAPSCAALRTGASAPPTLS